MKSAQALADILLALGFRIRDQIITGRDRETDTRALGQGPGDTVFGIDKRVEPAVLAAIARLPPEFLPVLVICEGLGHDGRRRFGPADQPLRFRILLDPVDGTRSLAYDKRSAWFLAAAAPDIGEHTSLSGAVASVMVELPTSKQGLADHYWRAGDAWAGARRSLDGGDETALSTRPSQETTLRHGFGQVSNFFPGTKTLAAELMEHIATETLGRTSVSEALIFDDQYICSGGQLVELMTGRDRFCCDLRPIFYDLLRRRGIETPPGLSCHPYDLAGLPIAMAAGVILTDGFGRPLDAVFDVDAPVHWCGYANATLQATIEPVIQSWLSRQLADAAAGRVSRGHDPGSR